MLKIVVFIRRKEGLSRSEFQDYYETGHRHLVANIAEHLVDYRRSYPLDENAEFDCMTELWTRDRDTLKALQRAYKEVYPVISADERNFIDQASLRMVVCEEFDVCEALGKHANS
jgi:hypothetical protein